MTTFSVPGANVTGAEGINNLDQVVGQYTVDGDGFGYRRDPDGSLTYPITIPGTPVTSLHAINDDGWMVGEVSSATKRTQAVLFRSPNGFVLYSYPGARTTTFTGVNSRGLICGTYTDDSSKPHGFIVRVKATATK